MHTYRIVLQPLTAFGTPLAGDTLFGQLCWTLRHLHGEPRLAELLRGYTDGQPFMVLSDAFPAGFIPLPALPPAMWDRDTGANRKALKKKRWLPLHELGKPTAGWQRLASDDQQVAGAVKQHDGTLMPDLVSERAQPHNSIDRMTGTTGTGQFAPYSLNQIWYHPGVVLDLYLVLDESRLSLEELQLALACIGHTGYGRDASIGLGKFEIRQIEPHQWHAPAGAQHLLTLASCAPQGQGFARQRSFYQMHTHFGRHGDAAALGANPFKQPLLMARSAAVFGYPDAQRPATLPACIGQGIAHVSRSQPEAVHQGYAPVLGILLEHAA